MATSKKIRLKTSDNKLFEMDEIIALEMQTIAHMIELDCSNGEIPLPNVTGKILAKVIEFCEKHVIDKENKEELKIWDVEFINVDEITILDLCLAADYLYIEDLIDLTSQTLADMIKGKTPYEIRKILSIENDLTAEEEEEIRRQNPRVF